MKESRFHGRGGQGGRMASEILAGAYVLQGGYAAAFPMFGAERRGAPVAVFLRISDEPIRLTCQVYNPDCIMILDPSLIKPDNFKGIKPGGIAVLNTSSRVMTRPHENVEVVGCVDAVAIALEEIGRAIVNTCMLGAFAKTTGWLSMDPILSSLGEFFSGKVLERNINSAKRGFEETEVIRFGNKV
ncbi:MAG: 2-oxoacid:acceptor oxidoreductase family protein [Chloroflexota bacterium]|nr:2-oxoacid:acceptor oxidoreductase family protein [Chloroflexota bacterium]